MPNRLRTILRSASQGWIDLLLPRHCVGCGSPAPCAEDPLCSACEARLPWGTTASPFSSPCSPAGLDGCAAAVLYRGEVEDWIHRFKYPRRGWAGLDATPAAWVRALAPRAVAGAPGPPPDWVVPVPLHRIRLRERGFNPAALFAREVARCVTRPLRARALERLRDTPSQTGLGRRARARNVAGAFAACSRVPPGIWLVDDVVTTGATLEAAARALRAAGGQRIVAVCIASTPR